MGADDEQGRCRPVSRPNRRRRQLGKSAAGHDRGITRPRDVVEPAD
jgi:hypothetical protein